MQSRLHHLDTNAHITGTPMIGMNGIMARNGTCAGGMYAQYGPHQRAGGYLSGHERPGREDTEAMGQERYDPRMYRHMNVPFFSNPDLSSGGSMMVNGELSGGVSNNQEFIVYAQNYHSDHPHMSWHQAQKKAGKLWREHHGIIVKKRKSKRKHHKKSKVHRGKKRMAGSKSMKKKSASKKVMKKKPSGSKKVMKGSKKMPAAAKTGLAMYQKKLASYRKAHPTVSFRSAQKAVSKKGSKSKKVHHKKKSHGSKSKKVHKRKSHRSKSKKPHKKRSHGSKSKKSHKKKH